MNAWPPSASVDFCLFFANFAKLKTSYNMKIELKSAEHLTDDLLQIAGPGMWLHLRSGYEMEAIVTQVMGERLAEGGEGKQRLKRLMRCVSQSS